MLAANLKAVVMAALILALMGFFVTKALAQNPNGDVRPGNGYGDQNHDHTGPPGLTIRP